MSDPQILNKQYYYIILKIAKYKNVLSTETILLKKKFKKFNGRATSDEEAEFLQTNILRYEPPGGTTTHEIIDYEF